MASSIPASVPTEAVGAATFAWPRVAGRRVPRLTVAGVGFVLLVAVVAVAAPWLAPEDPVRQSLRGRLHAPTLEGADGRAHLLGTDHLGRDVLSRVIYGSRVSLVVGATLELARAIVLEATLSFLGLGIQPPTPSWGGMIHEGRDYLDSAWWIATCPGIVLMLTSIVVSRTGDGLRDLLDPTLRGE